MVNFFEYGTNFEKRSKKAITRQLEINKKTKKKSVGKTGPNDIKYVKNNNTKIL